MTGSGDAAAPGTERRTIELTVNGQAHTVTTEVRTTLADMLRHDLGLTGTHLGCEHGVCGACTVLFDDEPVRSCLMLGVQAHGHEVRTIEGLADDGILSPLQQALQDTHAFQCGFCTPGFMMQITALLAEVPRPTEQQVRESLSGNLCRCTGYETIIDGVLLAAGVDRPASPGAGHHQGGAG